MTGTALALVLSAGFLHASWNYLVKSRGLGGMHFTWVLSLAATVIFSPAAFWLAWKHGGLSSAELGWVTVSAVFHTGYTLSLFRGYKAGDLSFVYPLARCTGPLLSVSLAIVLLGESPSGIALGGIALILGGVFMLTGGPKAVRALNSLAPLGYALLTGCFIAGYTLTDKYGVSRLGVAPLLFYCMSNFGRLLFMTVLLLREPGTLLPSIRRYGKNAAGIAVLETAAYGLVLTAMTIAPVSYVAPAREVSIVIGAFMGAKLLSEGDARRRVLASVIIMLGIVGLGIG